MAATKTFIILVLSAFCNGLPLESHSKGMRQFFSHPSRIVGGINAPEGYAPHMTALVFGNQYAFLMCGGSIVAPKLILTAAQCISTFITWDGLLPSFHGVVGTNNRNTSGSVVHFKDYHIHSEWNWGTIKNDIGFLVLDKPLTWSRHVGVVALNLERIERDEPSYVTGWGQLGIWPNNIVPYEMQLLYVNTISHQSCVDGVIAASDGRPTFQVDPKIEICTFHSIGHGMCNGDAGNALISTKTKTQIGIASWGFPCAVGAPDVFVRISGYKTYILGTMAQYS